MTERFAIKQDDTLPVMRHAIKSGGFPTDLTGATVTFNSWLKSSQAAHITGGSCTIDSAKKGHVSFEFSAAQTATAGIYEGEYSIDFGDGAIGTWPANGYIEFQIETEIA